MAILTWKNVDAPDLGTAGALLESANQGFMAAMNNLGSLATASRERRRDTASAQALIGAIGLKNPDQLAQYVQGLDARNLNADAVSEFLKMPSSLVRLQQDEVNLQDSRDDLSYQTSTRDREAQEMAARDAVSGRVNELLAAAANGDNGAIAALGQLGQQNPLAGGLIAESLGAAQSNLSGFQSRRGTEYAFQEGYEDDRFKEKALADIADLTGKYATVEDAITAVERDDSIEPEYKQTLLDNLTGSQGRFGNTSTEDVDVMSQLQKQIPELAQDNLVMERNRREQMIAEQNIEDELRQSPFARHMDIKERLDVSLPDDGGIVDYEAFLRDEMGMTEGWMLSGFNGGSSSDIGYQITEGARELGVSERDFVAAVIDTYGHGDMIGSGKGERIIDREQVEQRLEYIKNPGARRAEIESIENRRLERDNLRAANEVSARLLDTINFHYNNGNADKAAEAIRKLRANEAKKDTNLKGINNRYVGIRDKEARTARAEEFGPNIPSGPLARNGGLDMGRFSGDMQEAMITQELIRQQAEKDALFNPARRFTDW